MQPRDDLGQHPLGDGGGFFPARHDDELLGAGIEELLQALHHVVGRARGGDAVDDRVEVLAVHTAEERRRGRRAVWRSSSTATGT